jgi:hypothetical protein
MGSWHECNRILGLEGFRVEAIESEADEPRSPNGTGLDRSAGPDTSAPTRFIGAKRRSPSNRVGVQIPASAPTPKLSSYWRVGFTSVEGVDGGTKDPAALGAWYKEHLGIDVQEWGGAAFRWTDDSGKPIGGTTAWSVGSAAGDQFAPSTSSFMVN